MLHLQPISEEQACGSIKTLYEDIKQVLQSPSVPLAFQYIANFEEYFVYLWAQLKQNIQTSSFLHFEEEVKDFSCAALEHMQLPHNTVTPFYLTLPGEERQHITDTLHSLFHTNIILGILLIAVRESLKGVIIGEQLLAPYPTKHTKTEEILSQSFEHTSSLVSSYTKEIKEANTMLAPIFGTNAPMIVSYPDFFARVAKVMEKVLQTESYLSQRVELERVILRTTQRFVYPLENSYQKLVALAGNKPYFTESLYLLSETFPSQFPRLILTTSIMKKLAQATDALVVQ